jgi:hypothetical protein
MRLLTAVERFFERLFERPSARLFRARLQPVQIQRRIERAMEHERLSGTERTLVPNRFRVALNPADLASFSDMTASLAGELADAALSFARAHRYTLRDRPRVDIVADRLVRPGEVAVAASFADPVEPPPGVPAASATAGGPAGGASPDGADPAGGRTMVFAVPAVDAPLAILREIRPDGMGAEVRVDGRPLSIGRAGENGLVLRDSRVSRFHGRLQARRGALVYTDLGSTNGSLVNGVPVTEVVLGEGDRLELGSTVLVVDSVSVG